ncbi:MAG: cytochrome c3 family protein [Myxococcales bacterium]|nr:cytochrome c3 family protein [Myxococcales bacterium]
MLGGAATVGGIGLVGAIWYYLSPSHLQVGYEPEQPVPYSHRLHAGELGMDCRYCHSAVERSAKANIPPTQTCMGCHSVVHPESARLAPVRESWETGESIAWVKAHVLPDHTYFDHSVHLAAGVGCVSCHGRIDQMEVVRVDQPIAMQWCLECHRDPGPNLRPRDEITNMEWEPDQAWLSNMAEHVARVNPPEHCSGCHR